MERWNAIGAPGPSEADTPTQSCGQRDATRLQLLRANHTERQMQLDSYEQPLVAPQLGQAWHEPARCMMSPHM